MGLSMPVNSVPHSEHFVMYRLGSGDCIGLSIYSDQGFVDNGVLLIPVFFLEPFLPEFLYPITQLVVSESALLREEGPAVVAEQIF